MQNIRMFLCSVHNPTLSNFSAFCLAVTNGKVSLVWWVQPRPTEVSTSHVGKLFMSNYTPESEKYGDGHMTFIMHAVIVAFPDQHFLEVGTGQRMKV